MRISDWSSDVCSSDLTWSIASNESIASVMRKNPATSLRLLMSEDTSDVRARRCLSTAAAAIEVSLSIVCSARILRGLVALVHSVVAQNLGDPQPVVVEDRATTGILDAAMRFQVAPLPHRLPIAPE